LRNPGLAGAYVALIATALVFGVSFFMLQRVIGLDSPWLGLLSIFYFLALAKVAEPIGTLKMPGGLRAIRRERERRLYRKLLVPQFGKLLRDTPLRALNLAVYLRKGRPDLRELYRSVEAGEASHFWAAVLFTPYIAYVLLTGRPFVALVFVVVQVLFNVYPILHLRMVRDRLGKHLRPGPASRKGLRRPGT
jgi:hypothetical protein